MDRSKQWKGTFLILFCTFLWALNGNVGAWLFRNTLLVPRTLTALRLFFSGTLLLAFLTFQRGRKAFSFLKSKRGMFFILLYGFLGLLLMQYAYSTTTALSNAPTATLLQYLGAFLVVFVLSAVEKNPPAPSVYVALLISFLGVFLLVTGGNMKELTFSRGVLFYGALSMVGYAAYNLAPLPIGDDFDSQTIVGAGMFFSGTLFLFLNISGFQEVTWSFASLAGVSYSVLLGTLLPFILYMEGQKLVGPDRAPVLALLESVFSLLLSVLWLGDTFRPGDILGMTLILSMNLWLTLRGNQ